MSNQAKRLTKDMSATQKKVYETFKEMQEKARFLNSMKDSKLIESMIADNWKYLD